MSQTPLVTIGVPVYNEELFLEESLSSLLNQDYSNIEIIISDNASNDKTNNICLELAQKNHLIDYHRQTNNIGAIKNFIFCLNQAKGKYFIWCSGHDLWNKNYISECVGNIEKHKSAVIAFGTSTWIDGNGKVLNKEFGYSDTRGLEVIARYFTVYWGNMNPILGLIRTDVLRTVPMINTVGNDLIMLTNLSLKGDFIHTPSADWCRREIRIENYEDKLNRYKSTDTKIASSAIDKALPLLKIPYHLTKVVLESNVRATTKLLILFLLFLSFPIRYISGKRQYKTNYK